MRKWRRLAAGLIGALLACPAVARAAGADPIGPAQAAVLPAGRYDLDRERASLIVKAPYLGGLSSYTVRFNGLDGGFTHDPGAWRATTVTIVVDPRSIETRGGGLSNVVAAYLEPEKYPVIRFASTHLSLTSETEGRGRLVGFLTLHGVTRPVTLDVRFNGLDASRRGRARVGFTGSGRIRRSEFGLATARPFAGDTVELRFEVEFLKD